MATETTNASAGREGTIARPRLVIVTNIPTPYRTAFFNTLSARLDRRGIDLHVLYCAESEPNRHWRLDPEAQQGHAHTILPGLHLHLGGSYVHVNPAVAAALRRLSPRWLVVGGSWHMPSALLASRTAAARRAHRIMWSEGHVDAVLNPTGLVARLRRLEYGRFDGFAVPNARSGQYALQQGGREVPILPLPNTVDETFYEPPPDLDVDAVRVRLDVPRDARVLLTVCQLEDRKSVLELGRAFAGLDASAREGAMLVYLGTGPRRADLEALARDHPDADIRLLGHVSSETVRDWLWASDVFVLATRNDPNPLSPIEASFARTPLLLSARAGNVDELLRDGETGWRIDEIDDAHLQAALTRVLETDAAQLRAMGAAAHRNAASSFRRAAVADRFADELLRRFPA